MIKLVIADLDGTIYHNKTISKETRNTIKQLTKDGYIFTIATGRHMTAAKSIIDSLDIKCPVICNNGAYVGIPNQNVLLHEVLIDEATSRDVAQKALDCNTSFLLYTTNRIVATLDAKEKLEKRIGDFPVHLVDSCEMIDYIDEGILKVLIIEDDKDTFNNLYEYFSKYSELSVVSSNKGFIDIGNKNSSKGEALEVLCKFFNISLDQVLAVGDQENDILMLEEAKIGVAMGNASEAVKESADFITTTVEDDGFTFAINQIIFKK